VSEADLDGRSADFAMPQRLVQFAFDADRVITYWRRCERGETLAAAPARLRVGWDTDMRGQAAAAGSRSMTLTGCWVARL